MLSVHLLVFHANLLIDELEEEQAGQERRRRDFRARIKDIDAKKENNTMKRGEEAIKYAVSILHVSA